MKRVTQSLFFIFLLNTQAGLPQNLLRKHLVNCAPGDSSTFFYTNKTTAFYYGEACRLNASAFQGFNVLTREYFEDYVLQFDGNMLDRRTAEVFIYADRLLRKYSPQQITEEVILLDSLNVLAIKVSSQVQGNLMLITGFPGSQQPQDFEVRWEREFGMLHVGQRALMDDGKSGKLPAWTAVATRPAATYVPYEANERAALAKLFFAPTFVPGALHVTLRDSVLFYVIVGGDSKELMSVRSHVDGNLDRLIHERQNRLQKALERGYMETDRSKFDLTVDWAALSLNALLKENSVKRLVAN